MLLADERARGCDTEYLCRAQTHDDEPPNILFQPLGGLVLQKITIIPRNARLENTPSAWLQTVDDSRPSTTRRGRLCRQFVFLTATDLHARQAS